MLLKALCFLSIIAAVANSETKGQATEAIADLPFGTVFGNLLQSSKEFLGIPFASPPERFATSQPWTSPYPGGRLDAKRFQAQCLQIDETLGGKVQMVANFSEDCLFLNIYTPLQLAPQRGWPVMFWIHGGGFIMGTANMPEFNASVLAARENVVVVAANYRLGAFGFAATLPSGLNNGLRDQQVALHWVRMHIAKFGGDPGRVTLFGESAGGGSVSFHVWSPASKGLFHNAIAMSPETLVATDVEKSRKYIADLAQSVGCLDEKDLTCLRKADPNNFLKTDMWQSMELFRPTVDGDLLPDLPMELIRSGRFNQVPFIIGNTGAECDGCIYPPWGTSHPTTKQDASNMIQKALGTEAAQKITEIYALGEGIDNRPVLSQIMGDLLFWCNSREWALALAETGVAPWTYVFNRRTTPECVYADEIGFFPLGSGAAHGTEIVYVFDNLPWLASNPVGVQVPTNTSCVVPAEDRALGDKMAELWASFARNGRMNADWPQFRGPAESTLMIDIGTSQMLDMKMGHKRGQCDSLIKDLKLCEPGQCFLKGYQLVLVALQFWATRNTETTLFTESVGTARVAGQPMGVAFVAVLLVVFVVAGLATVCRQRSSSQVEASHYKGLLGA